MDYTILHSCEAIPHTSSFWATLPLIARHASSEFNDESSFFFIVTFLTLPLSRHVSAVSSDQNPSLPLPIHALNFGLEDQIGPPTARQLSSNTLSLLPMSSRFNDGSQTLITTKPKFIGRESNPRSSDGVASVVLSRLPGPGGLFIIVPS